MRYSTPNDVQFKQNLGRSENLGFVQAVRLLHQPLSARCVFSSPAVKGSTMSSSHAPAS